jgi:hypothetical protein
MKTKLLLFLLFATTLLQAVAQTRQIKGTVTDAAGLPLAGVSVVEKSSGSA